MYLEKNSGCRWNTLKHVSCDELHVDIGWSTGDNVCKVKHAAFDVREGSGDGGGGATMPAADVDQRVDPTEHLAALPDHDRHQEAAVRDHAFVQQGVYVVSVLPDRRRWLPERQRIGGRLVLLLPEPLAHALGVRGDGDRVERQAHEGRQGRRRRAHRLVADEEAGGCRQPVDSGFAGRRVDDDAGWWLLDAEGAEDGERAHEAA